MTFEGPSFHTADWRDDVDLTDKRVAVIGAGASGFQLVPAIADQTAQVDVYQRTAAVDGAEHQLPRRPFPTAARWAIRHLPYYGRWLRFVSWWPIADALDEQVTIDPDWDTGGLSCQCGQSWHPRDVHRMDAGLLQRRGTVEKGHAELPADGQNGRCRTTEPGSPRCSVTTSNSSMTASPKSLPTGSGPSTACTAQPTC